MLSKAWKWEKVSPDDVFWLTPSKQLFYLCPLWKQKGFSKFLDVGCGMGRNAVFASTFGFETYAFDLSEQSVERTKTLAEKAGATLKSVRVANMLDMPYADNTFDCLFAMYVVTHTDTEGFIKVMSEIFRVLKPGGEAYFTVLSSDAECLKNPDNQVIDEQTMLLNEEGPEKGVPHFYMKDGDEARLFSEFEILDLRKVKQLVGDDSFEPHYHVLLKKPL